MARLPRRSPFTSAPLPPDLPPSGRPSPAFDPGEAAKAGSRQARGGDAHVSPDKAIPFDDAIEAMLAAGGVDPVTRIRLGEARRAMTQSEAEREADGADGASLTQTLFRFVMPRLRYPEVLRTDRHRTLLEGLADGLAGMADDGIARAGSQVIHRELRRLTLLRTARNALVKG